MPYSLPLPYLPDASVYFAALRDLPWAAWLDSGGRDRYDILVAQPVATLTTCGALTEIHAADGIRHSPEDPFALIREFLGARLEPAADLPFTGGALGFWSYDLARRYRRLPEIARDGERLPDMAVGIYDWAIVLDHRDRQARLVSRQHGQRTALERIAQRLRSGADRTQPQTPFRVQGKIASNFTSEEYARAFAAVQAYLHDGDCYQVNIAQRFAVPASGDAFAAYLELRRLSPAPYAAFLDWPQVRILCASPEQFLKVRGGRVETRPIKGTRPRGRDAAEDARLKDELRQHPKDRAENLMIVDLLRNDLGMNCSAGSVRANRLFEVETFANVHHLVSTVTGILQDGRDALDLLRDCFPGGSITGAPKQRAMEIIEQLEPHRRGVYCGSIGYVGYDGNMDSNIAIRTLVHGEGEVRCWAGGGLVADSQCAAEHQETLDKAAAMLEVLRRFSAC